MAELTDESTDIRETVRERYAAAAVPSPSTNPPATPTTSTSSCCARACPRPMRPASSVRRGAVRVGEAAELPRRRLRPRWGAVSRPPSPT